MLNPESDRETSDVVVAIESLYADQLKPYGRILLKRLAERAHHSQEVPDMKRLRGLCLSCTYLTVQAEEGGEWSAQLRGRPASFVDVYSPQDLYPAQLWQATNSYFESLEDATMALPGGRYSCAQALLARNLPFLRGYTLGQVCHIVQLAISQKKQLGYLNGAVVPYGRSQSMVKERCAERQRPCSNPTKGSSNLASLEDVRSGLAQILADLAPMSAMVPLSNIKRLFRSRYHVELSETALGHSKLSELLQDPIFHDICSVRLDGNGYFVVPGAHNAYAAPEGTHNAAHKKSQQVHQVLWPVQQEAPMQFQSQPLQPQQLPPQPQPQPQQNFVYHVPPTPVEAPLPKVSMSAAALGARMVSAAILAGGPTGAEPRQSLRERAQWIEPLDDLTSAKQPEQEEFQLPRLLGSMVRNTFIHAKSPQASPQLGAKRRSSSLGCLPDLDAEKARMSAEVQEQQAAQLTPMQTPRMPETPSTPGFPSWGIATPSPFGGEAREGLRSSWMLDSPVHAPGRVQHMPDSMPQENDTAHAEEPPARRAACKAPSGHGSSRVVRLAELL